MLHEFAVEPNVLNSWHRFQFFMAQFGVEHGRLISRYPKRWKRMVYDSLHDCNDMERKRIEEALTRIDRRLLKRSGEWEPSRDWLNNAEHEHVRAPFRAIVANENPRGSSVVLAADDLDATSLSGLWVVPRTSIILRAPEQLADAIAPIIRVASKVLFIDPFFGPENLRHRLPLERIFQKLAIAFAHGSWPSFEYHLADIAPAEFFRQECAARITPLLPSGISCRFVRWDKHGLHNRYVLTDCGGVELGQGLGTHIGAGPESDHITLLGSEAASQLFELHTANPVGQLVLVDEVTVVGT